MEKDFTLTRVLYDQIRKHLKDRTGLSALVKRKGIPVAVISAVADGWVPKFPPRGRRPAGWKQEIPDVEVLWKPLWSEKYERCPECGGLVHLPCLACSLKKEKTETRQAVPDSGEVSWELNLPADCYQRYLKIREKKMREELERNCREATEWEMFPKRSF